MLVYVLFGTLLVFMLAITVGIVTDADSGALAEWVIAFTMLGALVAGLVGAWFAVRAYETTSRRDRRYAAERRAEQASRVAAWIGVDEAGYQLPGSSGVVHERGVLLRNGSDLPVYAVGVWLLVDGAPVSRERLVGTVTPAAEGLLLLFDYDEDDAGWRDHAVTRVDADFAVGLAFRDAAGRPWWRAASGALKRGLPPWPRHDA